MPNLFSKALECFDDTDKKRLVYFTAFIEATGQSFKILCVYAFWLVVARWLPERIPLGDDFVAKLEAEFNKTQLQIYWYFLNEIKAKWRDRLMDSMLIFIAEVVRQAFNSKLRDHALQLNDEPVFLMLCDLIY